MPPSSNRALADRAAFRWLWFASAVSGTGSAVSTAVLPIVAATVLGASTQQMSILVVMGLLPPLLLQLPIAAWADTVVCHGRWLSAGHLASAVLMATIPVAWWLHRLDMAMLLVVMAVGSVLSVSRASLAAPLLYRIVPESRLVAARGQLEGTSSATDIGGKGLAGLLLAIFSYPLAVLVDVASFVLAAGAVARIHEPESVRHESADADSSARASEHDEPPVPRVRLMRIAGGVLRRADVWAVACVAFVNGITEPVLVIYAVRTLHVSPWAISVLLGVGSVGGIVGGFAAGAVVRRLGHGGAVLTGVVATACGMAPLPFVHGSGWGAVALVDFEFAGAFGGTVLISAVFGAIQTASDGNAVARTMAVAGNCLQLVGLVGIGVASAAGSTLNTRGVIAVAAASLALAVVPLAKLRGGFEPEGQVGIGS